MSNPMQLADSDATHSHWHWLYKVSAMAALVTAVLIIVQMIVFMLWPPPSTTIDYFNLFQNNALLGFLSLDLLYIVDNVLLIPILLALYIALRKTNESFMVIGTALGFVGIACLFASNPSVSLYSLSEQYATAITDVQRSLFLAAGQALLASYSGTAYHLSLILGSVALVIICIVMLQSKIFGKTTAYMGILANALALGLYVPQIGLYILLFSIIFLWIWYALITRKLFQLGWLVSKVEKQ